MCISSIFRIDDFHNPRQKLIIVPIQSLSSIFKNSILSLDSKKFIPAVSKHSNTKATKITKCYSDGGCCVKV